MSAEPLRIEFPPEIHRAEGQRIASSRSLLEGEALSDFRECGHYLVAWIDRLAKHADQFRVPAPRDTGNLTQRLSAFPPQSGESIMAIMSDLDVFLQQGGMPWNHPRYLTGEGSSGSGPLVLGAMLSAALGASGNAWASSTDAGAMTETVVAWVRQMAGLPSAAGHVLVPSRESGNVTAMVAALRHRALTLQGPGPGAMRVYASELADPALERLAREAGFDEGSVRRLPVDAMFSLRGDTVAEAMASDRAAGLEPCLVVATVGSPPHGSTDALAELAAVCARRVWLHVDAYPAGGAPVAPEFRPLLVGGERAESIQMGVRPWLHPSLDTAILYSRHTKHIQKALEAWRGEGNHSRQHAEPFDAFSMWFTIRCLGWDGLAGVVRERARLARLLATWVDAHPDFERLAPVPFATVCFRVSGGKDPDDATRKLVAYLADEADVHVAPVTLGGRQALAVTLSGPFVDERVVREAWALIRHGLKSVSLGAEPGSNARSVHPLTHQAFLPSLSLLAPPGG